MKGLFVILTVALAAYGKGGIYDSKRLIQTSPTEKQWLDKSQIFDLIRNHVRFRDITDIKDIKSLKKLAQPEFPTELTHQTQVQAVLPKISADVPKSVLTNFTSFENRYYNSENGKKSSDWLLKTIKDTVPGVNATQFQHRFPQSSIIARIEGASKPEEIVVLSAHQDSINQRDPETGRSPGADDDGSGTVTILEALRVFAASGLKPARTVEFHWYAGEEGGLLGSADVVKAYKSKSVVANLQFDMTGFPTNPPAVGIVTDHTDAGANEFLRKVVKAYTDLPTKDFQCGYGCSDHASWDSIGVRASIPFESPEMEANSNIHSEADDMSTVDFNHLVKFANIAVGWAIEVSDAK
ncbi:hypothetical protein GGI12_002168 [Dipsacomyces acuminosporus]|nr:hypothetical protein GGI12_002168 [Dipsacomyces acuminosporus]